MKPTFIEFAFGYYHGQFGYGPMKWWMANFIQVGLIAASITILQAEDIEPGWKAVGAGLCTALVVAWWVAIWFNWRKPIDHAHPNAHTLEVCEECDPIQMRDGGPVTNIVWWYAAYTSETREWAQSVLDNAEADHRAKIVLLHNIYLDHPKFRNYPRP